MILLLILALLSAVNGHVLHSRVNETVTIDIKGLGSVFGSVGKTWGSERPMYSFYGVPYGQDTSGENRFKESKMAEPWGEEILDVRYKKPEESCPQLSVIRFGKTKGSEDCLKLYIFSTKLPGDNGFGDLPVMVWFHGGGFVWGDMLLYRGNRLLDKEDIILVVPHYRLGTLGFMCVHTEEAPGNAGLSDQVLALEWIQKYISSFGGDPSKVVISGESAGAASSSHLMLYDGAKDLFRGIITESGTALNPWALDDHPVASSLAYGARIGCEYADKELDEFVKCMRSLPVETIVENWLRFAFTYLNTKGWEGLYGVTPVVQKAGARRIISEDPLTKLQNQAFHPVPLFSGNNLHEGSIVAQVFYWVYVLPNNLTYDTNFWNHDAWSLILRNSKMSATDASIDALLQIFLPGVEITDLNSVVDGLIDMLGTLYFKQGTHQVAELVALAGAPAYVYSFEFDIIGNLVDFFRIDYEPDIPIGVSHGLEFQYIFPLTPLFTRKMNQVSGNMVKMWTNFVKHLLGKIAQWEDGLPCNLLGAECVSSLLATNFV